MNIVAIYPDGEFYALALFQGPGKPLLYQVIGENILPLIRSKISKNSIMASCLSAQNLWFKNIHLAVKDQRAARKTLPFQLETSLPCAKEEVSFSYILYPKNVVFLATSHLFLQKHIEQLSEKEMNPQIVSTAPTALLRFMSCDYPHVKESLVAHLGMRETLIILQRNGELCNVASFAIGYQSFREALQKDLKGFDEKKIDQMLSEIALQNLSKTAYQNLQTIYQEFLQNFSRVMMFFRQKEESFPEILCTGEFTIIPTLAEEIIAFHQLNTLEVKDQKLARYAVVYGLGLDIYANDSKTIQLRQGRFLPQTMKKNIQRRILKFYAISLCLAVVTIISGVVVKKKSQQQLKAVLIQRSPHLQEKSSLSDLLEHLQSDIAKKDKQFNLDHEPIKVSRILNFLIKHPYFLNADKGLLMKSFSYELIDHPTLKTLHKQYVVKIHLGFNAPTQVLAREFYDALKKDPIVDSSKEVSWNQTHEEYQISCFLK